MTRICGATDSAELKQRYERSWKDLLGPVERLFVNDVAAAAAIEKSGVTERGASFVTVSTDIQHMKRWEHSAGVKVSRPDLPHLSGAVEANLHCLTRDFGACLAIPILYGRDFLNRYVELLDDFWKWDNDIFPLLMAGVPTWVSLNIMKEGLKARSRLVRELAAFYQRVDQYQRGGPVDFGADMSDVSGVIFERNEVFNRENWAFEERAACELVILWGQNANTQPLLFWFLAYVYRDQTLLKKIREEIAPHMKLCQTSPTEIQRVDLPAVYRDCQLMKACIFETYRLAHEPASVRYVARPITIEDGEFRHEVKAGAFVSAAHSLTQRDTSMYADPDTFKADRFMMRDPGSDQGVARYGALRPWGVGAAMCKGRTFAEKEIMALGAVVISLWDISPISGTWNLPDVSILMLSDPSQSLYSRLHYLYRI